ncbi:DUF7405 family protein [Natronorubrum daqingense]|uniref:Tat pathway signal protein n=1 Tax=Natronorubrum daqingense TaxID=588898 RepID=A0A1N6XD91_9EURY|nr:Tat pathway signal protein [Natronorubrum daqingense]APX95981.1 Tat pathway signal protein [Natronorubrum daqingense]SIR00316.1 hypothetical protein SAMN05421809_0082 [Natronorubrum daqingense]
MTLPDRSGLSRRDSLRALVAIGGATALSACLSETEDTDVPSGTDDPDALPSRQHAWNESLARDDDGNVRLPEHHVLVALSLLEEPSEETRAVIEAALRTLERAYEWSNDGLVFTLGYTPAYFERFDESLPETVDLPAPEALTEREEPSTDSSDAVIHLASDHPDVVLEVEEGLFGERSSVNGVDVETDLTDVFERLEDERRTGFVGAGLPAEHTDVSGVPDSVPEEAPFFMGFRSGFDRSQADEDRVTIEEGPFEGATTQHVESMDVQLRTWFEQESHRQRVMKTFSPQHADEELVGEVGEELTDSNELPDERIDATEDDARSGVVGHAQKAARGRIDGEPPLLRRDFNTVDGDTPGLHFLSLQRDIETFVDVREAMEGEDLAVSNANNGIRSYLFVSRRGNYLIPSRSLRALPPPDPGET